MSISLAAQPAPAAGAAGPAYDGSQPVFTCLICSLAFYEPEAQRAHFSSDHHRYNAKRRVASLPPVSAIAFNQKVIERREQTAIRPDPKGMTCDVCKKVFTTENSYRSHVASKKHREKESKYQAAAGPSRSRQQQQEQDQEGEEGQEEESEKEDAGDNKPDEVESYQPPAPAAAVAPKLVVAEDATEEDIEMSIDAKIAAARQQIPPTACLFCTSRSNDIATNIRHMTSAHSFYIPDAEYLVDLPGLLGYLGEKLAIGNTCLYCPNGGKEFNSLEAVRAHMRDRSHCKIAYETEADKLEVSDFYDFESSYPDAEKWKLKQAERMMRRQRREEKRLRKEEKRKAREEQDAAEGWEEVEEGEGQDARMEDEEEEEVVVIESSEDEETSSDEDEDVSESEDEDLGDYPGVSLASDGLSLRLPDGRTLGHRSLKVYYDQKLRPLPAADAETSSSAVTLKLRNVRTKLADPTQALIPVSGGSGGYGKGLQVMNVRNAGEARWAKNIAKQNRDYRKQELHKTRVAIKVHNSQKHFRDPLLQ